APPHRTPPPVLSSLYSRNPLPHPPASAEPQPGPSQSGITCLAVQLQTRLCFVQPCFLKFCNQVLHVSANVELTAALPTRFDHPCAHTFCRNSSTPRP